MADVGQKAAEGILDSGTLTYGIRENTLKVGFEGSNVEVPNEIKKEMETLFWEGIFWGICTSRDTG